MFCGDKHGMKKTSTEGCYKHSTERVRQISTADNSLVKGKGLLYAQTRWGGDGGERHVGII